MNANTVVATVMNEDGVLNITAGQVASERLRRLAVAVLKELDPEGYAAYKAAKHGDGAATPDTRRNAYSIALARACEIAVTHYIRNK